MFCLEASLTHSPHPEVGKCSVGSSLEGHVALWVAGSFLSKDSAGIHLRQQVLLRDQEAALRSGSLKSSGSPLNQRTGTSTPPGHSPPPTGTQGADWPSGVGRPEWLRLPLLPILCSGTPRRGPGFLWPRLLGPVVPDPEAAASQRHVISPAYCSCTVRGPPLVTLRASLGEALWFLLTQFRKTSKNEEAQNKRLG